ncbi:MAG: AAA family ATPase [Duncaniella sp.]|uniref:AAA domain-containing protein n=1 Tax=Duncaniella sp. TaxID=2518496 RepID=UPI0023D0570A|nr:AAA domain-containing protein [Duncaniella sp.]MDE5989784.1 AAA family ATPase [Duncaniella sp.]
MELTAVTEDFDKKFSAAALHLLNESEELFIGQFIKFENGEMIVKFRASRAFPRKGEYVQAMYLPAKLQDYRQWDDLTYEHLFKNRLKGSEAVCIWQTKSNEDGFVLLGFRGIELDFADYISKAPGALIIMGPHRPPIDYLANLYRLTKDEYSQRVSDILDYPYCQVPNIPIPVRDEQPSQFIYQQIHSSGITLLQGPPGTGKTHLIAELCAKLCGEEKSVLVTALTNRALIEIATKPAVDELLKNGKVLKSNLTVDEQSEVPQLSSLKQLMPIKGSLVMATYYIVSGFAADLAGDEAFDVVIMDEASQALTPMFAAANKIGHTNLWVGDIAQLEPVIALNEDRVISNDFYDFVNGLMTMSNKRQFPNYQLIRTYRLPQRNADYTGLFYRGTLVSAKNDNILELTSLNRILHANGGPTLVLTDMNVSDATPQFAMDMATFIVYSILNETPSTEVSVLTCLRKTTRALQKAVALRMGLGNKVLIETIARVQGLTTDITIFFIPNTSLIRSLEPRLFNVATSRAKSHTIIIADKNILSFAHMNHYVRSFLEKLNYESCTYIPANNSIPLSQLPSDSDISNKNGLLG